MGGFHTLYLAANQSRAREQELLVFDHYLAMDSPMDLLFSMRRLDQYFLEPLSWPSDSRREKIQDTMQKTLAVSQSSEFKHGELPYTAEEARYLIGLSFKISLRDLIYATQRRLNLGVLKNKIGYFKRDKVYDEIMEYSFMEYYKEFLMSYFSENHGDAQATEEDLRSFGTLETFEAGFKEKENWDLILNRNDFLLSGADLQWLLNEMPSKRLHIFSEGGHLGNLWKPEVQAEILARLNHLLVR